MENQSKPILSCAGRTSVTIDNVLLQQLLENFTPTLIDVQQRSAQIATRMANISYGEFGKNSLEVFKETITEEFLFIQLLEASRLAKETAVVAYDDSEC